LSCAKVWSTASTRTSRSSVRAAKAFGVSETWRVTMTSTRSLGRMKPPAPVSVAIGIDTARMPGVSRAAMKPAASA